MREEIPDELLNELRDALVECRDWFQRSEYTHAAPVKDVEVALAKLAQVPRKAKKKGDL